MPALRPAGVEERRERSEVREGPVLRIRVLFLFCFDEPDRFAELAPYGLGHFFGSGFMKMWSPSTG